MFIILFYLNDHFCLSPLSRLQSDLREILQNAKNSETSEKLQKPKEWGKNCNQSNNFLTNLLPLKENVWIIFFSSRPSCKKTARFSFHGLSSLVGLLVNPGNVSFWSNSIWSIAQNVVYRSSKMHSNSSSQAHLLPEIMLLTPIYI